MKNTSDFVLIAIDFLHEKGKTHSRAFRRQWRDPRQTIDIGRKLEDWCEAILKKRDVPEIDPARMAL